MKFPQGQAFSTPSRAGQPKGFPVAKEWFQVNGKRYLIEKVPWNAAVRQLSFLPETDSTDLLIDKEKLKTAFSNRIQRQTRNFPLEPKFWAKAGSERNRDRMVATTEIMQKPAFVFDYVTVVVGQSDYWFKGDTTYYVTGAASFSGSKVTFEGGAILKFNNTSTAGITVSSASLDWLATPYRPVIFTGYRDTSVGENVGSGSLSGYYGGAALTIASSVAPTSLHDARFANLTTAISLPPVNAFSFKHLQFVSCQSGIIPNGADFNVRNCLFDNVANVFGVGSSPGIARVEHVTIDGATWLNQNLSSQNACSSVLLTNSILASVANKGSLTVPDDSIDVPAPAAGLFKVQNGGAHYLADGSLYRNYAKCKSTINPGLLSDLRNMTTYAPTALSVNFAVDTILSPSAPRDTDADGLDCGYHYWPIDYIWQSLQIQNNATVRLTNGVAIASYGSPIFKHNSLNSTFISVGGPLTLNHISSYHSVQERTVSGAPYNPAVFEGNTAASTWDINLNFTDVSLLASGNASYFINANWTLSLNIQNSLIRGGYWPVHGATDSSPDLYLKNNIIERCYLYWVQGEWETFNPRWVPIEGHNNLFLRNLGGWVYNDKTEGSWFFSDNLFASNTFTVTANSTMTDCDYNAFTGGNTLGYGSHSILNVTLDFIPGPLGSYYYPGVGGTASLASLINKGSRPAAAAGLYHFSTDGGRDYGTVDIGFHYVATAEEVWVDDNVPTGTLNGNASWDTINNWINTSPPGPLTGSVYFQSQKPLTVQYHQSFFFNKNPPFATSLGDFLFAYIYIPSDATVNSVMLQWASTGSAPDWAHRAFWGDPANFGGWGTLGTASLRYISPPFHPWTVGQASGSGFAGRHGERADRRVGIHSERNLRELGPGGPAQHEFTALRFG